jgi:hypothetical protein
MIALGEKRLCLFTSIGVAPARCADATRPTPHRLCVMRDLTRREPVCSGAAGALGLWLPFRMAAQSEAWHAHAAPTAVGAPGSKSLSSQSIPPRHPGGRGRGRMRDEERHGTQGQPSR